MRPTDENQSTSMRPNLISPRRASTSGEDSILAMLERKPARKRGGGVTGARLAWYGAGAAVAMVLTGSLVWLAANNDGMGRDLPDTVLADAGKALRPVSAGDAASPAAPGGAAAVSDTAGTAAALHQVALATPTPETGQARAAVIVDQPPPADAPPPLRLLKPAPAQSAATPAPAAAPAPAARPGREALRTAKPPARATVAAVPPPRAAAAAPSETKAPARPAATATRPRPVLVVKNAPKPAGQPKAQRSAVPPKAGEAGVDADVALISAVIVHANGHAPEGSQMTELLCPNDSCQPRPSRQ